MPTPPIPPTYWWLTVRIDACRTRDERVAAASGDDAVRMWRELHPNVEVIHVRPVPEPERVAPKSIEERIAEADAAVEASMKRIRKIIATPARQLAAKANRSAVSEGREPASVVSEPSDEELLATLDKATATFPPRHPEAEALNAVEYPLALELRKARAVLARFGHQPAPPAEGDDVGDEARYLVKELRDQADDLSPTLELFGLIHRAADLLEQRHPAPVPVSERLPGPEDCDAEGRVWWLGVDTWMLRSYVLIDGTAIPLGTHWLPATALPLPAGDVK